MITRIAAVALAALACAGAHAYCIVNELHDRSVRVEQEQHPDPLRNDRRFLATLHPRERRCCFNLDCNPEGRTDSVVNLAVTIEGDPVYECGFPQGSEPNVKVTGNGTVRILRNPRTRSAFPYIVRVRTRDHDLTGPRGLVCPAAKTKGNP
jgi:hypothetical protein